VRTTRFFTFPADFIYSPISGTPLTRAVRPGITHSDSDAEAGERALWGAARFLRPGVSSWVSFPPARVRRAYPLRHMPAQQSPSFKFVQAIVQAKANLGPPAGVSHIGDKLLLRLADFAFGVGFDLKCVKQTAAQQN
jgi:hypothetical protein